ncbi:MAG: hypothetical protein R3E01_35100 [Pirellulaceae bacterium]|nr:hypothetical protein [Planctomycetales bacterium]
MATVLTLADYPGPPWDSIELSEDQRSYRAFWAAVLQFATADGADEVIFDLNCGYGCLATVINEATHTLVPPPAEYRDCLFAFARRLAAGGPIRSAARYWSRVLDRSDYLGRITLRVVGRNVDWSVFALSRGVRMRRVTA